MGMTLSMCSDLCLSSCDLFSVSPLAEQLGISHDIILWHHSIFSWLLPLEAYINPQLFQWTETALGYPRNQCLCYHRNRLVSLPCPDPYQYIDYSMPDWSPAPTRPYVIIGVTGPLPLPGPRSSWERLVPFPHQVLGHPRKDWSPCPWSSKVPGLELLKEGWSTSTLVTQCDTGPLY